MKTKTLVALTAALFLSATPLVMAQAVNGSVAATLDSDPNTGNTATNADTNAGTNLDLTLDTNADGEISDAEAAAGASANGSAAATTAPAPAPKVDAMAAGDTGAAGSSLSCDDASTGAMADADLMMALEGATSAQVLSLNNCEEGNGLTADIQAAVSGNEVVSGVLRTEAVNYDQIVGITVVNNAATIYISGDETSEGE